MKWTWCRWNPAVSNPRRALALHINASPETQKNWSDVAMPPIDFLLKHQKLFGWRARFHSAVSSQTRKGRRFEDIANRIRVRKVQIRCLPCKTLLTAYMWNVWRHLVERLVRQIQSPASRVGLVRSNLGWHVEWHVKQKYQEISAKCQNPLQTTFFNYWFFCVGKMVQVEELNQEFGSLHYIFFGPTGASTKMSSKVFTHWCFSNLMALKPSLKPQLLTGSLNLTKILNG